MMNTKAQGSEENDGIDRISSLPDDVRTHILSFVSTREAVQTCILSKRWINTWASVRDLKFHMREFGLVLLNGKMSCEEIETKFKRFVKNVLDKRETSCVNRFRLWMDSYNYWPCTEAAVNCIGDVMKMEPRECSVKLYSHENLNVNMDAIFTCAPLIYLQLWILSLGCYVAVEPNSVNLPCLKTLNLDGVTVSDDTFQKLLLGCPVLEELVLLGCSIGIIKICSNTLKKLVLRQCYDVMSLQISTQNLLYLDIYVDTRDILLLNMPLLVNASIYLPGWYDQDKYVTMGPKLIHSLSNVESLLLEFDYPNENVQKKDFSSCPVFNNLKCLELVSWGFHVFELAPYFLHHSPKLQQLTLTIRGWFTCFDEETTQAGPRDALVQREFLKTVRIVGLAYGNKLVDRIIKELRARVKIIGEIKVGYHWELG